MKMWLIKQLYSNLFTSLQLMVWSLQNNNAYTFNRQHQIDWTYMIYDPIYSSITVYTIKKPDLLYIYIYQFCAAFVLLSLRRNRWPEIWRMTSSLIPFRPMTNSTKCLDQIHRHKELLYILRFWKPGRKRKPKVRVSFGWVVCTVGKGWSSKKHQAIKDRNFRQTYFIFHVPKEARERMTFI